MLEGVKIMYRTLQTTIALIVAIGIGSAQTDVPKASTVPFTVPNAQVVSTLPWMNTSLTPEQRADLLIPQMTLEQKVEQISNDTRPAKDPANRPPGCEFTSVGRHIQGIPALAIPTVRMINGGTGIRGGDCRNEPTSTGMPSTLAGAAT